MMKHLMITAARSTKQGTGNAVSTGGRGQGLRLGLAAAALTERT
jgi:hypothetical protein